MLELININKFYNKKQILKNINVKFEGSNLYAIIGANGSGKSTLLKIISGILKPDSGEIRVFGKLVKKDKEFVRDICIISQENILIEDISVDDNIKFFKSLYKCKFKEEYIDYLLQRLRLKDIMKNKAKILSGGQKKKLSIFCSLIGGQSIIIFDEPSTGLDIPSKEDILDFIKSLSSDGNTVIISSHDEAEIRSANKVFIIKDSIIESVDEIKNIRNIKFY